MDNIFSVVAPDACTEEDLILGILPEVPCQLDPKRSEIDLLIFKGTAAGPTSMGTLLDWASKIDNTDNTGAAMKYLIGKGSKGEPEDTKITVARDKEVLTDRVHTVVFEVTEISDSATYDFLRKLQTGVLKPNLYYKSIGNFLYGKVNSGGTDDGIVVQSYSVSFPKESGKEAIDKAILTIKFSALVDPDRVPYVLSL